MLYKWKAFETRAPGERRPLPWELNSWTFKCTISSDIAPPPPPLYFIFWLIVIQITPNLFFMDSDSDPDHSQNLITCSLPHLGHILKISSKSVYNFLTYLSLKITFHASRRSGSLPKSNHFFLLPFRTYTENFIKILP